MVTFVWSDTERQQHILWGQWRSVVMECGDQFVTIIGMTMMLKWFVGNLDFPLLKVCNAYCQHLHCTMSRCTALNCGQFLSLLVDIHFNCVPSIITSRVQYTNQGKLYCSTLLPAIILKYGYSVLSLISP